MVGAIRLGFNRGFSLFNNNYNFLNLKDFSENPLFLSILFSTTTTTTTTTTTYKFKRFFKNRKSSKKSSKNIIINIIINIRINIRIVLKRLNPLLNPSLIAPTIPNYIFLHSDVFLEDFLFGCFF